MKDFDHTILAPNELRKGLSGIKVFCNIFNAIRCGNHKSILIDFQATTFIHPHYAVLIAAISYIAKKYNVQSTIRFTTANDKFLNFIRNTGIFANVKGLPSNGTIDSKKNKIPFIVLHNENEGLAISEKIINSFPIDFSDNLKTELVSKIFEIISNAFTHSKCNEVFCCGCLDDKKNLHFSIYDMGIGIPKNVNKYLHKQLSDEAAIRWAWEKGNSTLNGFVDYPRGAGLDLLKDFSHKNNGDIFMISGGAFCKIKVKESTPCDIFQKYENDFLGTFFSMTIKNDNIHRYISGIGGINYVDKS